MKRMLLLPCLLFTAALFGQFAPGTSAPLFQHLHEVNAEWQSFNGTLPATPVRFSSDTQRIAQHLNMVREHLAAHAPMGLSATQTHERKMLLQTLNEYAHAGRFPQNHVLPYRNPIFIDPAGTACAVGHLMIASGSRALAERIDAEMETGYLAEIIADQRFQAPVSEWASAHGFTAEELAWIQPGYPPAIPWITLGGGTNGIVDEVLPLPDGTLLVAGRFTEAGGVSCQGAARWNGSAFSAMGSLPEGVVNCAVVHDGVFYLGGSFNSGQLDLLKWTGTAWVGETVFASKSAEVTTLHSHDGELYAAGGETGFVGTDYGVKVKQGTEWQPLPGVLNGPIHALEHYEGFLVAGGAFTGEFLSTEEDILHVARYMNSGWVQIADGLDGDVYDLLLHEDALYATGDMVAMTGPSFGLASIVADIGSWTRLMPNIMNYISNSPVDGPSVARAMVVHEGRIFIAGDIHAYEMLSMGRGVVVYNGTPDAVEPYCDFQGPAHCIALLGEHQLVVGGDSEPWEYIISTDLAAGVATREAAPTLEVFPNPAQNFVSIAVPHNMAASTTARLTDAHGRTVVLAATRIGGRLRMDISKLASGIYTIEVFGNDAVAQGRLVKE